MMWQSGEQSAEDRPRLRTRSLDLRLRIPEDSLIDITVT